ncbi:MAG TPA: glycosyltransferase family 87 protein, partial [Phototrophicaceae bacterium]|nr:glycosyltransferase family 87 protein [Phototrophicaceae bacterium]
MLLFITLWLLSRYIPTPRSRQIFWAATPFYMPVFMSFFLGQSTFVQLILLAGAWVAFKENKRVITGVLIAFAVWLKFYPGLFIIYFLWKRDWRVVTSSLITTALVILFQIAISGLDAFIVAFAQKLFSESPQVMPLLINPLMVHLTRFGLTFIVLGALFYLTAHPVRMQQTTEDQFDLEYAVTLLSALLLGSTLGIHAMLPVLPVFVILLRRKYGLSHLSRYRLKLLCTAASILINIHWFIMWAYVLPPSENVVPHRITAMACCKMCIGMPERLAARSRVTR